MSEERYVGVKSRRNTVYHAVWVTHTRPVLPISVLARQPGEDMFASCGVRVVLKGQAGPNHGFDWDRLPDDQKCLNCRRDVP